MAEGGVFIEALGGGRWFIDCQRADGSSFCLWIKGKVTMTEERPAPGGAE